MSFYTITPIRQLISVVCQICSKAICYRCYASGSLNVGDVGCWELVKVGGVDTKMYRTGHPHACSINLTTFWYRSCVAHAMKAERCAPPGVTMPSLERAFVHWSATKKLISLRHKRNVDALSLTKVGFNRALKISLIYHELFGCYVPSLWTLRIVRTDCSRFYQ